MNPAERQAFSSRSHSSGMHSLLALALLCSGAMRPAAAQLPAFPGAEGAGAYAKGGRGGDVYHVVNLEPSGPGSLAEGFNKVPESGRTIVFDVSGYIPISGRLVLNASKVTIAGQTAPGDGIGLKGGTFRLVQDDVIIRHLRFRNGRSADSVNVDGTSSDTIFDHCDVLLGKDENFSSFKRPPENLTMQWSVNAWGMETHSAGGLWDQQHATAHHSLWSHNHTRNPKARPNGCLDWINNVTFDWDIGFILGDSNTTADWKANIRGCYFICPPGNIRPVALEKAKLDAAGKPNFILYIDNSLMDSDGDGILSATKKDYALASGDYTRGTAPFPNHGVSVTVDDPLTSYKKIVSAVGPLRLNADPTRPLRDEVSTILVDNLVKQRRHHVSAPAETGAANEGFGVLNSSAAPKDSDQDGMPDFWEVATGSNPTTANHNDAVPSASYLPSAPSGYTLLEEYLHFLATPHAVVSSGDAVEIDLARYTSGFTKKPAYAISAVANGAVTLQPGGSKARFSPKPGFVGRAKFDFKVTDADGSNWTQTCLILAGAEAELLPPAR